MKNWIEYDVLYYGAVALVYIVTVGGALAMAAAFLWAFRKLLP